VVLDKIGKERSKKLKNVISRGSENEVLLESSCLGRYKHIPDW